MDKNWHHMHLFSIVTRIIITNMFEDKNPLKSFAFSLFKTWKFWYLSTAFPFNISILKSITKIEREHKLHFEKPFLMFCHLLVVVDDDDVDGADDMYIVCPLPNAYTLSYRNLKSLTNCHWKNCQHWKKKQKIVKVFEFYCTLKNYAMLYIKLQE